MYLFQWKVSYRVSDKCCIMCANGFFWMYKCVCGGERGGGTQKLDAYVCAYTYIYMCTHAYITQTYTCTCAHTHVHIHVPTQIYINVHIYINIQLYINIQMY